ncbi:MAG TPA: chromosome segregation protein SMC [Pyrinomonadaceae bacterium]|nr:chromosome segregation protein SMC [Pyrinomonadaceae bacterium]
MFKLQRLEITGFKSFADHTEIVFTGNGITAVVGPNGCGKSNVSDCISWVLGEQRAKTLRGGEMKDVIFQGSKNRKPAGMAEVVLHLVRDEDAIDEGDDELFDIDEALDEIDEKTVDVETLEAGSETAEPIAATIQNLKNGDGGIEISEDTEVVMAAQVGSIRTVQRTVRTKRHWRPRSIALDFAPGEAVSVTRRLYLSGESEYQLNGQACRLRDIQDLFAGTGLSGAHYAIVEQGRIGQVISAKPSDRRILIEEAAGISKFRTRQRAAEARLESAKANLSRISDIVTEIDKQANSLRRQAAKTRRYVALQEEFRGRLLQLYAAEGQYLSTKIHELETEHLKAEQAEIESSARVAESESWFREATEKARSTEDDLARVRHELADNALERDRADREHRYQSEQVVAFANRLESIRNDNVLVKERIKTAEAEIARLQKDEIRETSEADAARLLLVEAEKIWGEKLSVVSDIEQKLDELRASLVRHSAAIERFNEIHRQLTLNDERATERKKGLERELERAERSIEEHRNEVQKILTEVATERAKLDGLNQERSEVLAASGEARKELEEADDRLKRVENDASAKRHRLDALREIEEKRAAYLPQVQKLFADEARIGVKLEGVLADHLNVDESAEKAIELLLGPYLQAVLVPSYEDAVKVGDWAASTGAGRIITIVVASPSSVETEKTPAGQGRTVADSLGLSPALLSVLRGILPRELDAIFVNDVRSGGGSGAEFTIDNEGRMAIGRQLFIGGSGKASEKDPSLLAFKRELSTLERSVIETEKEIGDARETVELRRKALAEYEERIVDLQSLIIKVERGLVGLEINEKASHQELERAERHRNVVKAEIADLENEKSQIKTRLDEALVDEERAEANRRSAAEDIELFASDLLAARSAADAEFAAVNEKRTLAATSGERRRSVLYALKRLEDEKYELETRSDLQHLDINETEEKIQKLRSSIALLADRISSSEDEIGREQTLLAETLAKLDAARKLADSASDELAEANRRAAEAINARSTIEVSQAEAVTELKNLNEKCVHELALPLAKLLDEVEINDDFDLENTRNEVEAMRHRLDGFGAINMLAVEELTEAEERLDFLTSQRQDIIDSIASAEEALREIKVRSRARFKEAFEAINRNFGEYFSELFGGGRGEMSLLEADDILEAGIEIVAQPPGKRLQNILLLSGGEKAMTAIALVLSIFKYRPSPFCLLDEVDAPLDDANVGRFVARIAEMAEKTQFIVITHNKRTMEAARALYGVTMQEAGVSKIVSVNFD